MEIVIKRRDVCAFCGQSTNRIAELERIIHDERNETSAHIIAFNKQAEAAETRVKELEAEVELLKGVVERYRKDQDALDANTIRLMEENTKLTKENFIVGNENERLKEMK